jgi:hypothetical protein
MDRVPTTLVIRDTYLKYLWASSDGAADERPALA